MQASSNYAQGVAVKRFYEGVLSVSTGLQDVQIVPFLLAISPAVASCVLVVLSSSDLSSSLLSLSIIVELAEDKTEDNNCGITSSLSLERSSSVSQVVIISTTSSNVNLDCVWCVRKSKLQYLQIKNKISKQFSFCYTRCIVAAEKCTK